MGKLAQLESYFQQNYEHEFHDSLLKAKGGLILIFILITLIYQFNYRKVRNAQTFFSSGEDRLRIIGASLTAGALGMLSTMFLVCSRSSWRNIPKHTKGILIVGVILSLFALAQESSGFNRWMAKAETEEGKGAYAKLDRQLYGTDLEEHKEGVQDPFLTSISYLALTLIAVGLFYFIGKMILAGLAGWKYASANAINAMKPTFGGRFNPMVGFAIELIVIAGLNALAPALDPEIRGEPYGPGSIFMIFAIAFIAVCLHFMLQYTGMLSGF